MNNKNICVDDIKIRFVDSSDAKALSEIYKPYVENTAVSFEYVAPDEKEFLRRIKDKTEHYPFIVAEYRGKVIGYTYASPFLPRPAYLHSVETTLYINEFFHGLGLGKLLYTALEEVLKLQNVISLNACIAVTHNPDETLTNNSMYFHDKMGYRYVGRFNCSGYKFDRFYDMIWMEKIISPISTPFPDFISFKEIKNLAELILPKPSFGL